MRRRRDILVIEFLVNEFVQPLSYVLETSQKNNVAREILKLEPTMARIFPELKGVKLEIRNRNTSWHVASYEWRRRRIEMNFRYFAKDMENTLPFVLAHETMHAVQWIKRTIPHGERACDIFTLSRLPVKLYPKKKAFYVRIPKRSLLNPSMVRETASKAIDLRLNGVRRYIKWFENELRQWQS